MTDLKYIVGLTGGMGAGKSTLVEVIKEAGIPVWDADQAVHRTYRLEHFLQELEREWDVEGDPRAYMARVVTADPSQLPKLENILEQWIEADLQAFMHDHVEDGFVVMDAPLLFEGGYEKLCDSVIAIQCPLEIRKARCMTRPNMTEEKFAALTARQLTEGQRLVRSQYIIHNDDDIEVAKTKMRRVIEHLKEFYQ